MTSRVNTVSVVLLMVLSVLASGLYTAPNTVEQETIENEQTIQFSGNNSSGNEWLIVSHSGSNGGNGNYSTNDIIALSWYAGNLVNNVTYNVSATVHGYTGNYSNNSNVTWTPAQSNYTVFNTSGTNFTSMFQIAAGSLSLSPDYCYFAQFELYDEATRIANNTSNGGQIYTPNKLDLGCITNGSGNNSSPMEWLVTWAGGANFTSSSTIGVNWSAGDLVTNTTYNVTLDVYAHNSTTNTTYVIWDDYTVFNATSNASSGAMYIPNGTLPTGCYYASVSLYDNDDGMHFDADGFDLDVGMDCSNIGNNTGGNNTNCTPTFSYSTNQTFTSTDVIPVFISLSCMEFNSEYESSNGVSNRISAYLCMNLFQNGTYISQSCLDSYNGDSVTQVMWDLDNDSDSFTEVFYINGTKNTAATSDDNLWPPSVNNLALGNYQVEIWLRSIDTNTSFNQTEWFNITVVNNSNTGPMESVYGAPKSNTNYTLKWQAFDLAMDKNYNVTIDIWAHNETTNTSYVIYSNYTVFDSGWYTWNSSDQSAYGFWQTQSPTGLAYSVGCYYVSIDLFDNVDGMHFDNYGFDFDVDMDCSGGSGNNSGPMESVWGYSFETSNGSYSEILWEAYNLVNDTNYNVTFDLFQINSNGSLTPYWTPANFTVFNSNSIFANYVYNANNSTAEGYWTNTYTPVGCYYVSIDIFDDDDGMHFDNYGFDYDVGMDCSNNTGGNNTGNASEAFVNAWPTAGNGSTTDYEMSSTSANITIGAFNLTYGSQYLLEFQISNETGNIVDGWSWNWTAMDVDEVHWIDASSLGQGCYDFAVLLSDELGALEYENWPFTIDMTFADCSNNTGGNNTGNATDCGTLENLTELMVWTDYTMYYEGDTVEATFVVNCTVLNYNYRVYYELNDSNYNSIDDGVFENHTLINSISFTQSWSNLTADSYCLTVMLYKQNHSQNTWIVEEFCFDVNEPTTAWGNGTARFIYIKPLAQNADEHTPFNLTFPAPPMADGSPYMSNMICSKVVGHSADVWETYVPMPYNNITSWKVENTYGLVMGMFVMYDAQAAGIGSMQNPTVIFEQNMSFSGHAPSVIVDQAYFNCPMVTVSSSLSPVMSPGGSVLSYVAGLSVNNSGDWTGDLNWEVATVTNGSSTALMDIGGHLLVEATGALLDHDFSPTGIVADEICLNWELIDENGDELSSGSECINFVPLSAPTCTAVTISNVASEYVQGNSVVAWFNTELDCHGHALSYWVDSSTIGEAYSGVVDINVSDTTKWASTGSNEVSMVQLFQTGNGGLIADNHCITVQISAYDATGGVISPHITSDTFCFDVVTSATEECIPWNNADCNTEFACPDGKDKVAVDATDNVTGNAIEIWDCQESEDSDDESSGFLPSIGAFGTLAASMFAVFIVALRRDEE